MSTFQDTIIEGDLTTSEIRDENGTPIIDIERMGTTDRYLRQYIIQDDQVDRSFTTAWGLGPTFSEITGFKANSLLHLYYLCPMRNDSTSWGGAYIEPQVRFNQGTWQSLGSCGYDGGVMGRNGTTPYRIVSYRNTLVIDPQQTSDFTAQFRFYCRSYDGTVSWNGSRDIGLKSETAELLTLKQPNTRIFAKAFASDGTVPLAGIYTDDVLTFDYGRDWHISVWDINTGDWATGINFFGASQVIGSHARYDIWDTATRTAQSAAFVNTINGLSANHVVIVAGSHAPEFHTAAMRTAIYSIGGSPAKMGWTTRESYICVGQVGLGQGNAYREELSNLNATINGSLTWARVDVNLTNNIADIVDYGGTSTVNDQYHMHIKVKEFARLNNG